MKKLKIGDVIVKKVMAPAADRADIDARKVNITSVLVSVSVYIVNNFHQDGNVLLNRITINRDYDSSSKLLGFIPCQIELGWEKIYKKTLLADLQNETPKSDLSDQTEYWSKGEDLTEDDKKAIWDAFKDASKDIDFELYKMLFA